MKQTQLVMGMPVTVEIAETDADEDEMGAVFEYFRQIDRKYSPYKPDSEVSLINSGRLKPEQYSTEMTLILALSEQTKRDTAGFFDIYHQGVMDPSGLVKGWAVKNAADILRKRGRKNFYIDAGGDIEIAGVNGDGDKWRVGIRNPFNRHENVKTLELSDAGVATSGTAIRGNHIYNPKRNSPADNKLVSITVIGPDVYEADRMATAAFVMGTDGIEFIENSPGLEGYAIDTGGIATFTSRLEKYLATWGHS